MDRRARSPTRRRSTSTPVGVHLAGRAAAGRDSKATERPAYTTMERPNYTSLYLRDRVPTMRSATRPRCHILPPCVAYASIRQPTLLWTSAYYSWPLWPASRRPPHYWGDWPTADAHAADGKWGPVPSTQKRQSSACESLLLIAVQEHRRTSFVGPTRAEPGRPPRFHSS